jgi:hypothetical protein
MKKEEGMWKQKPLKKQNKKKALKSTKLLLSKSQKRTSRLISRAAEATTVLLKRNKKNFQKK